MASRLARKSASHAASPDSLADLREQACLLGERAIRAIGLPHSMRSPLTDFTGIGHAFEVLRKGARIESLAQDLEAFQPSWARLPDAERFFFFSILSATPLFAGLDQDDSKTTDAPNLTRVRKALIGAAKNCLDGLDLAHPVAFGALNLLPPLGTADNPFAPLVNAYNDWKPFSFDEEALEQEPLDQDDLEEIFDLRFCALKIVAILRLEQEAALLGIESFQPIESEYGKGTYATRVSAAAQKSKRTSPAPQTPQLWPVTKISAAHFYSPPLAFRWARRNSSSSPYDRQQNESIDVAPLLLAMKAGLPLSSLPKRGVWYWEREESHLIMGLPEGEFLKTSMLHHSAQELTDHLLNSAPPQCLLPWIQQALERRPEVVQSLLTRIAPCIPPESAFWTPAEHPHWLLAQSAKRLEGSTQRLRERLVALGETFNTLGFGANGTFPNGQKAKVPDHAPTPFFTLAGGDPQMASALSPVLSRSGALFSQRNTAGVSALGLLNTRLRTAAKTRTAKEVESVEGLIKLWVSMGADPLSIAAQPDVVELAATRSFKELVSACVERQALVNSLSENDLKCALELLKQHREQQKASSSDKDPALSPPARARSRRI